MDTNPMPFKACWPLTVEYNFNYNRIVKATIRTDAGDSLSVEFKYAANAATVECETRRLSIPETTELLQWAYNVPKLIEQLQTVAALTHFFMKVTK